MFIEANYSDGRYFHYTYDWVGNRLSEEKCLLVDGCDDPLEPTTTNYTYDNANRLTHVNGQAYTWDDNGNLIDDGTNTYTYDAANRLTSVDDGLITSSYVYNGLGDRLSQTVDSVTTDYVLDLNTGLTQVLDDGTNTYLYGNGRIGELQPGGFAYHLGDALGSVRQLTDDEGDVTLARSFEPYGNTLASAGDGETVWQFTGEARDGATNLTYLRARFYSSSIGIFQTKDVWPPDYGRPFSLNGWNYAFSNPVNYTDPSGHSPCDYLSRDDKQACLFAPPDIDNYNQKFPPHNITWVSNIYGDLTTYSPIFDTNGNIVQKNAAQFEIPNYLAYGHTNTSYCGQVAAAAILRITYPRLRTEDVVETYENELGDLSQTGTTQGNFVQVINNNYGSYWQAESFESPPDESQFPSWVRSKISSNYLIASLVQIESGSGGPDRLNINGKVVQQGPIVHWVIITGISQQWDYNPEHEDSPWNWVRVFNPFDNEVEYYPWRDFRPSWRNAINAPFGTVLLQRYREETLIFGGRQ